MKKKGFTLIELLAVLVVLAILALISIPITIRIINNAGENSYKRSIVAYGKAVKNAVGVYLLEKPNADYSSILLNYRDDDSSYISSNNNEYVVNVDYNGQRVRCSNVQIKSNGDVKLEGCFVVGHSNNKLIYNYENNEVHKPEYTTYNVGDTFAVNNEQYYVISDAGKYEDYLVAIKKNPLTVSEVNLYGGVGTDNNHVNKYTEYSQGTAKDISYWDNTNNLVSTGIGGVAYYSSETCGNYNGQYIADNCKYNYNDSDIKYIVDNWSIDKFPNDELKDINGYKARILSEREFYSANSVNVSNYTNPWLSDQYLQPWIFDPDNNAYNGWHISWHPTSKRPYSYPAGGNIFATNHCIRPVINVYKNAIE